MKEEREQECGVKGWLGQEAKRGVDGEGGRGGGR